MWSRSCRALNRPSRSDQSRASAERARSRQIAVVERDLGERLEGHPDPRLATVRGRVGDGGLEQLAGERVVALGLRLARHDHAAQLRLEQLRAVVEPPRRGERPADGELRLAEVQQRERLEDLRARDHGPVVGDPREPLHVQGALESHEELRPRLLDPSDEREAHAPRGGQLGQLVDDEQADPVVVDVQQLAQPLVGVLEERHRPQGERDGHARRQEAVRALRDRADRPVGLGQRAERPAVLPLPRARLGDHRQGLGAPHVLVGPAEGEDRAGLRHGLRVPAQLHEGDRLGVEEVAQRREVARRAGQRLVGATGEDGAVGEAVDVVLVRLVRQGVEGSELGEGDERGAVHHVVPPIKIVLAGSCDSARL